MNALPRKLQAQQGPVWIYNPLPEALHHYEESLFDVLAAARHHGPLGGRAVGRGARGLEVGPRAGGAGRAGGTRPEWQGSRPPDRLLADYGLLEPALWLPTWRGSTVSIVVHTRARCAGSSAWAGSPLPWVAGAAAARTCGWSRTSEVAAQRLRANPALGRARACCRNPLFRARARRLPASGEPGTCCLRPVQAGPANPAAAHRAGPAAARGRSDGDRRAGLPTVPAGTWSTGSQRSELDLRIGQARPC